VSLDTLDPRRYADITRGGDVRKVLSGIDAARRAGLNPVKLNCVVGAEGADSAARDVAEFAAREGLAVRFIRQMDLPKGCFAIVQGGSGGDCARCNRLRLTSDGQVRPCLFADLSFSVRRLGAAAALTQAVAEKPLSGSACCDRPMHLIGG
jgi:cyclic pyranopterin phosphate synthase